MENRKGFKFLRFRFPHILLFVLGCIIGNFSFSAELISGLGGDVGFGQKALPSGDDGSSAVIDVSGFFPSGLNFFGQTYSALYVNNNGNITFKGGVSSYTPSPFPISNQPMIAPYWGDVDTRASVSSIEPVGSNAVYYGANSQGQFIITWFNVGYFSSANKLNSFQLVLTERSDTGLGNFDVEFRYNRLEWTTGNASGGSNGLGGTPAQVGFDAGDSKNYFAHPDSRTHQVLDLVNSSNVGIDGVWRFRLREGEVNSLRDAIIPIYSAEGNGTSVFIDWTDYPEIEYEGDSENEIAFYRIYQSSTAFSKIFDENVRLIDRVEAQKKSITVSGLVRNEVYHYAIVAEDRFGLALSAVESTAISPIDIVPPQKPQISIQTSLEHSIVLEVTSPTDDDFLKVIVQLGNNIQELIEFDNRVATIVFDNLQSTSGYDLIASSFDGSGNQSDIESIRAYTLNANPIINNVKIDVGIATLEWDEFFPKDADGIVNLYLEPESFNSVSGLQPKLTVMKGKKQAIVTGLQRDTIYYVALVAVNTHGALNPDVTSIEVIPEKDIEGPEISSITYNGKSIGYGMELTESGVVTAVLYDKSGIGRIDLSIDDIILDSRYGANGSYQYALNLENISDGVHTFKVVAKDTLENETVIQAQVVVNFKAPEAPILLGNSKSTGEASYQVSGKADPKALVSLYNNEQLIVENLSSNNGAFSYSLSLKEGPNKITAFARYPERTKNSEVSSSLVITLDSSVPKAPAMLNAQTLDSGRVVLTWPAVSDEDVVGYQLYRSAEPIMSIDHAEPLFDKPKTITKYEDLPLADGHYYYAVAALNNLGTPSDLAHADAVSDRQGPTIKIGYETNGAFDNTTKTYGRGVLTIQLTTDEELRTMPYLSLTAEGGVPRNIALQASLGMENTYEGTLELTDKLMPGIYWAVVGAYDRYGNRTGEVATGASITIDTQGPMVVSLNTTPEAPIQNSSGGREISILFALDEEHADTELPLLIPGVLSTYGEFTVLSGLEYGFSANKEANHWVAGMTLPAELAAEETETLYFKVITQDKLGNKREAWIEKSGVEIYQGELPALRAPNGLVANAMAMGKVQLSWSEVSNASTYRIYRTDAGADSYTLIKEQALFEYVDGVDSHLNDGNYQYYVTAVRSDNNQQSESSPSNVVQVTADSISPAVPQAVNVDLASNGVHVVWEKINEDATYNVYRAATSLEGSVSIEQVVLVGSQVTQTSTMDISPNSDEPYYYVTAVDKAGNESDLSVAAYLNASLLPVSKLHAVKDAEGEITLSWQHKGQSGLKYQITRTINGVTEVLARTEGLNYQDKIESQYPVDVIYSVTAIDRNNVSSLEHPITIPAVSINALENIVLQRGVMNKVLFRVDSLDGSLVKQAQLKVDVELNEETKTHLSERFSVESGAYATVPVVIAGYSDLEDYENLSLTLESEPQAGDSLRIHTKLSALAGDNGLLIELATEQAVKGASAVLKATITNPGSAPVEVVTAENRGTKPSSSLWVYLETEEGEVIAKTPVNINTGKVINLSSGHTVFRAEAGAREEMPPINIDIPSNAPDKLVIRLQANTIHYHLGYADHAEMRGSTATVRVNTEATPYRAEVTAVSATHISAGDKFNIEGQIIANRNNEPLNNRDVKIIISINGFDKMRTIKTDGSGQFNYEHQTDEDVSGEYLISVVHPLVSEKPIMARVSTERLAVTPTRMNVKVPYNYIATPSFKLSASELFSNRQLVVEVSDETPLPEGLTIKLPENLSISGGKSLMLPVELSATERAPEVGMLLLELKDTEGQFYSYIRIEYQFSKVAGAITFSKNYIETGLALGGSVQESIQLKNTGFTDLRDIQLSVEPLEGYSLPNWVAIAQQNIALLPIGGSTQTDIMITPDSGVSEGVHAFKLQATSAANGLVQAIPVYINVTQSGVGNAFFHVVDFYTGTLDKNNAIIPGLVGAKITLQNELVLSEEYELKTDQFGDAFFDSIPAGRYYYRISAFDHSSSSGRVWVKPGTTSSERVLLQNTLVSVEFSVKEITLQDKYDILLEARYETNVPAPVVVMNPLSINLPNMKRGEVFQGEFTLTNHGLIEAQEVRAMLPTGDQYAQFEFLRQVPNVLSAGEVFVMPYRVIALKNFDNSEDNMSGIASLLGRELATAGCYSHQYNNRVDYKFECAAGDEGTGSITQVYHSSGGSCGVSAGVGGSGSYGGYGGGGNGGGSYSTRKPQGLGYWMCVQAEDNDDNPDTDC